MLESAFSKEMVINLILGKTDEELKGASFSDDLISLKMKLCQ